ncbi:hypothetical protein LR48_Vigan205s002600 [Vigna angularis]|uniref:Uncharacterized protein n=1 Tax=Phaseolus angularis TaxID=3914 RepID=A0A0L9T704_PHAAN|nr:hypothetical protein LR48_Vigan205s002600 [Vigna angularis]
MDAWEGLVVDEDVLESFLKKCDASTSLIPSPAGNVEASFMNRISDDQRTTQQFAEEVAQATYDRDFNSNAWNWAEMFVQHHVKVFAADVCPPTKQLLEETSKPVIRQPMKEEETVYEIMRKLVNPAHKPSTSKKPLNNTEQNSTPRN